jgi:hypothetical protein
MNTYYLETAYETAPNSLASYISSPYEWVKFIFHVSYDSTALTYTIKIYLNNRISVPISPATASTTTNQSLQYICFCHLDSANCATNSNIYWSSGYYRNLKVWNADYTSPWVVTQFDSYFPYSSTNTIRPANLVLYYPLNLSGLADNVLTDPSVAANSLNVNSSNSVNQFNMQVYNFCSNIDYIQGKGMAGSYVSNVSSGSK